MPIYEFVCESHGAFDILARRYRAEAAPAKCPECGADSRPSLSFGAARVSRDWNDKANDQRRSPYEQAKAQSWNSYNERRGRGLEAQKPTERMVQEGARQLSRPRRGRRPPPKAR